MVEGGAATRRFCPSFHHVWLLLRKRGRGREGVKERIRQSWCVRDRDRVRPSFDHARLLLRERNRGRKGGREGERGRGRESERERARHTESERERERAPHSISPGSCSERGREREGGGKEREREGERKEGRKRDSGKERGREGGRERERATEHPSFDHARFLHPTTHLVRTAKGQSIRNNSPSRSHRTRQ